MANELKEALIETANELAGEEIIAPDFPVSEEISVETEEPSVETVEISPAVEKIIEQFVVPEDWSEEERGWYSESNDPGRQMIEAKYRNLESGYQKKREEFDGTIKDYEAVKQALQPYSGLIQQHGLTMAQAVQELANSYSQTTQFISGLQHDAAGAIKTLLGNYIQDPNKHQEIYKNLAGSTDPYEPQAPVDHALNTKVDRVIQRLDQSDQIRLQADQTKAQNQIVAFSEAKDDKGNLKHPHFEKVRENMGYLKAQAVQKGNDMSLDVAYEKAVRLDDDLFSSVLEKNDKKTEAKAEADRKEAVAKAKTTEAVKMPETKLVNGQSETTEIRGRQGWAKALSQTVTEQ